jgi:hypothetical protein
MTDPSDYFVAADRLIRLEKRTARPHVVILGAGASLAAFPTGDAQGQRLPLMANVVQTLHLQDDLTKAGIDPGLGFETLYSQLHTSNPASPLLRLIEARVQEYFSRLSLPEYPTLYDFLLLSLREKDAIFTFNWDPFLVDAYLRHQNHGVPLPHIFHLHGNVRVSFCATCGVATRKLQSCPACGDRLQPSQLLYPVEQKDYASNTFVKSQWDAARDFIRKALIITVFGYSAPKTDKEAMAILTDAWRGVPQDRLFERVEIVDVRDKEELAQQWAPFSFFHHYDLHRSFLESLAARYPRRSCEAMYYIGVEGKFTHSPPWAGNMEGLRASISGLMAHEKGSQ